MVGDKAISQLAPLWSWGYPWRISILGCKPDLLQSTQPRPLGPGKVCCAVLVSFDVPVTTGLTVPQQCGRQP